MWASDAKALRVGAGFSPPCDAANRCDLAKKGMSSPDLIRGPSNGFSTRSGISRGKTGTGSRVKPGMTIVLNHRIEAANAGATGKTAGRAEARPYTDSPADALRPRPSTGSGRGRR